MLRYTRLILTVFMAMLIVAVPTAVAQSPSGDQYQNDVLDDGGAPGLDDGDSGPVDDGGTGPAFDDGAPGDDGGVSPAQGTQAADGGSLPFTGGQMSLIALIGLGLLAAGLFGFAASRRRGRQSAT